MTPRIVGVLVLASTLVLSGCAKPTQVSGAPAPGKQEAKPTDGPASAQPPSGGRVDVREVNETRALRGVILLRPASNSQMLTTGDSFDFFFDVPNGTLKIVAHAEWSPPQDVGLQFRSPSGKDFVSWKSDSDLHVQPPIDMTVEKPETGKWWAYLGPSVVGGGLTWNMTLTLDELGAVNASATSP